MTIFVIGIFLGMIVGLILGYFIGWKIAIEYVNDKVQEARRNHPDWPL
jgi:uncharacterized protein YneF (UPF0154 family)